MKHKIVWPFIALAIMFSSCVKDLDVKPIDENLILAGNLKDRPDAMRQTLAKIYASFVLSGQSGDSDITSDDANFTTFIRSLWNCQELTTDEVKCAWGDPGIPDLNTQTWTSNNPFLEGIYARIIYTVTLSNDYIRLTADDTDPDIQRYRAEARFLRALAYFYAIDLFGNPAFTTEADGIGKFLPKQITRSELFDYIESELLDIEDKLGAPKFQFGRADQAAAQMLLARLYLNAEVYTGTAQWDNCKTFCDKVISSGAYSLELNYRKNFSSDNDESTEMIFSINQDGINTQGAVGVSFIINSSSNGTWVNPAPSDLNLGTEQTWGGNRTTKEFANILVDFMDVYGTMDIFPIGDVYFANSDDSRVYIKTMEEWDISQLSTFAQGAGVYKFTNSRSDGGPIVNYNSEFASTDFPIFRLADAYLMRAEALYRSGNSASAVADINIVRERAFGDATHNYSSGDLTEQILLDERGREFYYEAQRRTDLVRFGQFSNGTYKWSWKGNVQEGASTSSHLDLFPIPQDEVIANTNITQNPGY